MSEDVGKALDTNQRLHRVSFSRYSPEDLFLERFNYGHRIVVEVYGETATDPMIKSLEYAKAKGADIQPVSASMRKQLIELGLVEYKPIQKCKE